VRAVSISSQGPACGTEHRGALDHALRTSQVYRARVRATGQEVAVKVQRPGALSTISKDLYVMRRGVGVYEAVIRRFTAQTTDYQQLLSTFAEGLYTEMDFRNEALNMTRMMQLLGESAVASGDVLIPEPVMELTSRRRVPPGGPPS
jgi:aarF domain-containing kinase